jgi:diguanylate cyclase (GGDEF)-like protein
MSEAVGVAEKLRQSVEENSGLAASVSISLGVSSYPETAASAEELIYEGDAAMYTAKMRGKNQVCRWDGVPAELSVMKGGPVTRSSQASTS